ncbi:Uncharacterised protein [Zhongshania aliphaticivorans]|nr:Uncharacterised protein [Zhongshania aliphaticivorans]
MRGMSRLAEGNYSSQLITLAQSFKSKSKHEKSDLLSTLLNKSGLLAKTQI